MKAIGYTDLFNVGNDYDVILLAPQISFMHAKVQEILKDKIVLKMLLKSLQNMMLPKHYKW